jgi:predicted nucleic acid-binding Zn ribbon protein
MREQHCQHCGAAFYGSHNVRYCTDACRAAARNASERDDRRWRRKYRDAVPCIQCGKPMTGRTSRRFCSARCRQQSYRYRPRKQQRRRWRFQRG